MTAAFYKKYSNGYLHFFTGQHEPFDDAMLMLCYENREGESNDDSESEEVLKTKYVPRQSHCKDISRLGREQRPQNEWKLLHAYEREKNKSLTEQLRDIQHLVKAKEKEQAAKQKKLEEQLVIEKANVKRERKKYLGKITFWQRQFNCAHAAKSKVEKRLAKITSKKNTDKTIKRGIQDFLATTKLTSAQQKMLMNPDQKWAKNSQEDICQALVLRCLSSKTYEALRKEKKLYYPSRHTIERHLDGILHCKPGYVHQLENGIIFFNF